MKLQNKAIVVTGASSGMGKAIVERFVKEGAFVVAVARRRERLEALAESLSGEAGRIVPYVGDVSKAEDCEGMIDTCVKEFGKLDVLVNNAGVMDDMSTVASATDEKYDYVMGINVYGPFAAMRKAVNVFLAQGNGGNIITVSSVGAQHQVSGAVYGASKAAVNALCRHTAFTYRNEKIRCNVIAPGGIKTEISTSMGMPNTDGYGRIQGVQALMPGMGEGTDIADLALFLAGDESAFVSGQIIAIDGGWTAF
ncbi:MAG: SDR family oxidoreductase [Eisenbergiella sp.]